MRSDQVALITGATGFIGSHLARRLVNSGWQVHALVRSSSSLERIADFVEQMTLHVIEQDLPWQHLEDLGHVDVVFHLATAYGRDGLAASLVLRSNVLFPLELLEAAIAHQVSLFISTDTCFTVDYPYLRAYTLGKRQFVDWARILTDGTCTKTVNLVLQHPYGPQDSAGKFVPWLIEQCRANVESIDLTSGDQEKDFIFVSDVVSAYETLADRQVELPSGLTVAECGTGTAISVKTLAQTIHRLTRSKSRLNFGALQDRVGEVSRSVADPAILRRFGWRPDVSLEEGLKATVAFNHTGARR